MNITKLVHSCLLVETPDRVALFDPGVYSTFDRVNLTRLDDIFITHIHSDHCDPARIKQLVTAFPQVRITAPPEVVTTLAHEGIAATSTVSEGVVLFESPHEGHPPFITPPEEFGYHYLQKLSHPGDSHSFHETMPVLALPVQAPWGSTDRAVQLGLELKPRFVVPIHDGHWKDEVRLNMYDRLEGIFGERDIHFIKPVDGKTVTFDI